MSVIYTNNAGCIAVIPASLDISINSIASAAAITITGLTTVCQGEVNNNMGSLVYEKKNLQVNGSTKQAIDLRNLPSGMYTVIFTTGINRIIRKMMVNR